MSAGYRDGAEGLGAHLRELVSHAERRIACAPPDWWLARVDAAELASLRARATKLDRTDPAAVLSATTAAEQWIKRIEAALVVRYAEVVTANALPTKPPSARRMAGAGDLGGTGFFSPMNVVERLRVMAHRAEQSWHCYISDSGDPCAELALFEAPLLWMMFASKHTSDGYSADQALRSATHMLSTTVRPSQPPLSLRPTGVFSSLGTALGLVRDAILRDEAFDEAFVVDGTDEAAQTTLLPDVRAHALELARRVGDVRLVVANGVARVWWQGSAVESHFAGSTIEHAARLLAAIRHAPVPEALRPPSRA